VADDGHAALFHSSREPPFLRGLRSLQNEFQRTKRESAVPVTLHIKRMAIHFVPRDELGVRLLHDLRRRAQHCFEQGREIIGQSPAKLIVRSLNHARRGTL